MTSRMVLLARKGGSAAGVAVGVASEEWQPPETATVASKRLNADNRMQRLLFFE